MEVVTAGNIGVSLHEFSEIVSRFRTWILRRGFFLHNLW